VQNSGNSGVGCFWVLPKISFEKIAIIHSISIKLHFVLCAYFDML
jgi:hypothetical protein